MAAKDESEDSGLKGYWVMYNYMIYIITSVLASLFSPKKRLGSILTVNDCDISKFILE